MYDFWESILFQKAGYKGNPMEAHRKVHSKYPLSKDLFDEWLRIFKETIDDNFVGTVANHAFTRASSIAMVTQIKLSS